jgi:cytochrome c6
MKKHSLLTVLLFLGAFQAAYAASALMNYDDNCSKCHGADGKGNTKMGKKLSIRDLSDAKVQAEFTDEQAVKTVKEGLKDKTGKTTMKAIEGLSDDDIKAVVAYVRGFVKK